MLNGNNKYTLPKGEKFMAILGIIFYMLTVVVSVLMFSMFIDMLIRNFLSNKYFICGLDLAGAIGIMYTLLRIVS